MTHADPTLLDAAHGALDRLRDAGRLTAGLSSASPAFGAAQSGLARAAAFEDAMLAAVRARVAELKAIAK